MEEAVDCIHRKVTAYDGKVGEDARKTIEKIMAEAREWFRSDDANIGTYRWVCHVLDIDPDTFRKAYASKIY